MTVLGSEDFAPMQKERVTRRSADTATEPELPPLVEAKLAAPRMPSGFVDRPRIRHTLDTDAVLTLVGAPAGYGKTTAVRTWCATRNAELAWVTLDSGDDDPSRLWLYVATAVDRIRPGLGKPAMRRISVPGAPIEHAVDELLNALSGYQRPLILVLDDLHTVTDRDSVASIDYALLHMPDNVQLIVCTRIDPALGVSRLRAARKLTEVRASDLAFTPQEAHSLLVDRGGLDLSDEQVEMLVERTEGWLAALVLAGIWLRTVDDPSAALSEFGGDQRFVADYLSSEVLIALDEEHRAFLEGIAVLGHVTPQLCDAVFDRADSAETLVDLERSNFLVAQLEHGDWFRIHPLFAEYARARLESSDPGATSRIHMRAAMWLRDQGRPIDAIAHASAAGEHEAAAELLAEQHLPLIRSGAGRTLLNIARTLPDDALVAQPNVAVAAAITTVIVNAGATERHRYLALVEQAQTARPEESSTYVEAAAHICCALALEGGVGRAVDCGRRAVELTESDGLHELTDGALTAYARTLYFAGELVGARDAALRSLGHPEAARRVPTMIHAHTTLALVAAEEERLSSAHGHVEQARRFAGRLGVSRSWLGANVAAAAGVVLAAEGQLADAERELSVAEGFFRDEVATVHHTWLLALTARVRARRGRLEPAATALGRARDALVEIPDAGVLTALVAQVEQELTRTAERASSGVVLQPPSESELTVLRLLATDLSTREIGEQLFLSANTVRSHRGALYHKLGVHSRAEAIARATALGLLDEADHLGDPPAILGSTTRRMPS